MPTVRPLLLVATALAALVAAAPGAARPAEPPAVDIQPTLFMAPDARSVAVQVLAECPERWAVVEASVSVSQPGGSGSASFPLRCTGYRLSFWVTVPASSGSFALAPAQVSASVVVSRGRTMRADDAATLQAQPTMLVELAGSAQLVDGGAAVILDVTTACPAGTTGTESRLVVSQGQAIGVGLYVPVCDGSRHTATVRVPASQGRYAAGIGQAITQASAEHAGAAFYAFDDDGALELEG